MLLSPVITNQGHDLFLSLEMFGLIVSAELLVVRTHVSLCSDTLDGMFIII